MGLHKLGRNADIRSIAGRWLLPGIVLIAAVALLLAGETGRDWLRFDRDAIRSGQIWRLLTGHFVHLGWPHFALNGAGLALVWYLVGEVFDGLRWILIAAVSILAMDVGLWIFDPELMWYVGLSGLLHGILAAGLVARLRQPRKETIVLMILLVAKLLWEQVSGPLPGSEDTAGGMVVVNSHLFGAIGGAAAGFLLRNRVRPVAPI